MSGTVSHISIACMAVSGLAGLLIPVALFVFFYKKKGADVLPFFVGCGVMLLFALILEPIAHQIILGSQAGITINGSIWLYACYGGLMAGLFEETGRFLAFQTVLRKFREKNIDALMYGAGHGGFESAIVLCVSMVSNIGLALLLRGKMPGAVIDTLPKDILPQLETAYDTLAATPPYLYLVGIAERVFAVALQISLSVLVWFSVKNPKQRYLFATAILIHLILSILLDTVSSRN